MNYLSKTDLTKFKDKKVLIRVDMNVPVGDDGIVDDTEDWRIKACIPTIQVLQKAKAKIALLSHLGRPLKIVTAYTKQQHKCHPEKFLSEAKKFTQDPVELSRDPEQFSVSSEEETPNFQDDNSIQREEYSLIQIIPKLSGLLGMKIRFVGDCISSEIPKHLEDLKDNEVLLLENVRFYKQEKENNEEFAKKLAEPYDYYVNEAFAVSHRKNASTVAITKFLDTYIGLQMEKEINMFNKLLNGGVEKPIISIIGGAKIETKIAPIKRLAVLSDKILVGGKVGNEILDNKAKYNLNYSKTILPLDSNNNLDIGPKTIKEFEKYIQKAKTIIFNGPLGMFEKEGYKKGTLEIIQAMIKSKAFLIIGGGDTIKFLERENLIEQIEQNGFISTGGGAMLYYLGG